MAKNNFNFQAVLNLVTKDFKKGANEVQSTLTRLSSGFKNFAATLAAGFSIGSIFSKLKDSTLELSTALNTLKNASKLNNDIMYGYGENMDFLNKLADKYGQSILSLTDGFSKFTGASYKTGISLDQQRKIFEALTRAAAYYHMSADQTRDMMNAITQMMSKGKVAAEELRRQLGNNLPGAFNLMAKSIGVSTAELDSMLKNGEVLSAEVLPKFANELNTITAGGNFDSLQNSLNKLENAWLKFVQNSGFEKWYKGVVDMSTGALDVVAKNGQHLDSLIFGVLGTALYTAIKNAGSNAAQELEIQLSRIEGSLSRSAKRLEIWSKKNKAVAFDTNIKGVSYYERTFNSGEDELKWITAYNKKLLEQNEIRKKLGREPLFDKATIKNIQDAIAAIDGVSQSTIGATTNSAKLILGLKKAGQWAGTLLKSFLSMAGTTLIFSAISMAIEAIVKKLGETKRLQKEILEISENYNKTIQDSVDSTKSEVKKADELLHTLKAVDKETNEFIYSYQTRFQALQSLGSLVDGIEIEKIDIENLKEGTKEIEKLTSAVAAWAAALEKKNIIEIHTSEAAKAQVEIDKLQKRLEELSQEPLTKTVYRITGTTQTSIGPVASWGYVEDDTDAGKEYKHIQNKIAEYQKVIKESRDAVKKYEKELDTLIKKSTTTTTNSPASESSKTFKQVYDDYIKNKKILDNKLREGVLDEETYQKQLDDLITKTWADAAGTGAYNLDAILQKIDKNKTLTTMEKWYRDMSESAKNAALRNMVRDMGELLEKVTEEGEREAEELFTKWEREFEQQAERMSEVFRDIDNGEYTATRKNRNSLFDFQKSDTDILDEKLRIETDYVNELESKVKKLSDLIKQEDITGGPIIELFNELNKELEDAKANATSLQDALDFATLQEQLNNIKTDLVHGIYDGVNGFVSAIDGIKSATDRLEDVLDDKDSSPWERFMAGFDMAMSYVDGAISALETLNEIMAITNTLSKAQSAAEMQTMSAIAAETAVINANTQAKVANATAAGANAAATGAEAAAATTNTAAKSAEAIAEATAQGAKVPFPANILAISAGVAAVVGALAALSKFENGGIVGGNSTHGDRNLVRINSGEMILNKAQQGTLFRAIASGSLGGGNVQFKIKGADLIGVISNENSRRRG